ncbi:MAG: porin family protein [Candidatus Cloacimonadota bacterium]|nr:porin family protein [Candidatus Cloacimonadota bacterium]
MKRNKILFFMLLLIMVTTSNILALEMTAKGIKGGVNFATVGGADREFFESTPQKITTFSVGGFLVFTKDDKINIQPEVYYCKKGVNFNEDDVNITFTMNYIEIPVLGTYEIAENIRAFAGPSLGIYMGGNYDLDADGYSDTGAMTEWFTMSGIDFGLVFGGSFSTGNLVLDARYAFSLNSVVTAYDFWAEDEWIEDDGLIVKNNLIQLLVGYKF